MYIEKILTKVDTAEFGLAKARKTREFDPGSG